MSPSLRRLASIALVACVLPAAACSRDARPAEPAPGPTCEAAVTRMTAVMAAQFEAGGASAETVAAIRAEGVALEPDLIRLCGEDAWSVELRTCIVDTPPLEVGDRCDPLITAEQRRRVMELRNRDADREDAP